MENGRSAILPREKACQAGKERGPVHASGGRAHPLPGPRMVKRAHG
jgi:hypothetical protein